MLRGWAGGGGKEQRGREMAAGRGRRGKGSRERVEKEQPGRETVIAHGSPAFSLACSSQSSVCSPL